MNKATLYRIGMAALSGMTDAEVAADPERAMRIVQATMRAALLASRAALGEKSNG